MVQSGGFLVRLLGSLLKTGLSLIKNVIKPLAKSVLIPLGLTTAASAADAGIHKKILGSGNTTTLIISNNEMEDLIKIVKSLEDSGLLLKGVTETVQNEVKEQKGGLLGMLLGTLGALDSEDLIKIVKSLEDSGLLLKGVTETVQNEVKEQKGEFLSMLLGILGARLLGNILTGKGINREGKGGGIIELVKVEEL